MNMASDNSPSSAIKWDLWVGTLPLLAVLPLLAFRMAGLWSEIEFVFVPFVLLIVAASVLIQRRGGGVVLATNPYRTWAAIGLLVSAALLFAYAVWTFSPWLGHFAAILLFFAWGVGRFGNLSWGAIAGWAALLATTLGLPFGWDQGLIRWLRETAAWACSRTLDGLEIPNLGSGNTLEIRGLQYFVDSVCGGWASFFTLLSIIATILLLTHRSMLVSVISVLFTPLWMLLIDYTRLLAVALTHEYQGRDMSNGLDLVALQVATFLFAVLLAWLLMRFLTTWSEPVPPADGEFGPVFSAMNKLLCWPQPDPFEDAEPEDPDDRRHWAKQKAQREAARLAVRQMDWYVEPASKWTVLGASLLVVTFGILPMVLIFSGARPTFANPSIPPSTMQELANAELPNELEGWKLVQDQDSESGKVWMTSGRTSTIQWRYDSTEHPFYLSMESAFRGWVDPTLGLQRVGWDEIKQEITTDADDGWPLCFAELENDLGGRSYVFSSLLDEQLRPFKGQPDSQLVDESGERANILSLLNSGSLNPNAVTIQVKLFCESGEALSRKELSQIEKKFLSLRRQFVRGDTADITADSSSQNAL